ncbi:MAG: phage tail tube protein [Rickettsiales bacterium]|nr:phage tail tube protein [Pseudomonadota bacterium]MDA0966657.1 phage tail tube protein [Pseudomonadota bacterium]MDG4543685.1 phage tail tube protein [Rickettsiales bacterium]MDG4545832.1 phage tail tube protein [Rickettsiales bacterium]MDG4547394.1 phage tail tube protein [Rickettsiales bacterium]
MTAQKGDDVILKVGNGATPTEVFTEIGGMINTDFILNNKIIEANNLISGQYRKINGQTGVKSLVVKGNGYFTDSSSEELMRGYAFSGSSNNYELHFGNGDYISCAFVVSSYERKGRLGTQEDFAVVLESDGYINFTNGA